MGSTKICPNKIECDTLHRTHTHKHMNSLHQKWWYISSSMRNMCDTGTHFRNPHIQTMPFDKFGIFYSWKSLLFDVLFHNWQFARFVLLLFFRFLLFKCSFHFIIGLARCGMTTMTMTEHLWIDSQRVGNSLRPRELGQTIFELLY